MLDSDMRGCSAPALSVGGTSEVSLRVQLPWHGQGLRDVVLLGKPCRASAPFSLALVRLPLAVGDALNG